MRSQGFAPEDTHYQSPSPPLTKSPDSARPSQSVYVPASKCTTAAVNFTAAKDAGNDSGERAHFLSHTANFSQSSERSKGRSQSLIVGASDWSKLLQSTESSVLKGSKLPQLKQIPQTSRGDWHSCGPLTHTQHSRSLSLL